MSNSLFDKNYYELFNVSEDASDMEIKKAYARLVRQYTNETHPEEFMHIRKAYQVLSNPSERQEYDRSLNQQYSSSYDDGYSQHDTNQYNDSSSYNDYQSSYGNQQTNYNDNTYDNYDSYSQYDSSYNDYDTYNQYDSSYNDYDTYNQYDSSQYDTYQYDNQQSSQQNYYGGSTTYAEEKPRGNYSLIGNIIFSIIISFLFTPVVGIITGIVIHVFKIPIMKVVGCIFWIVVALIVLGFLLEML